MDEEDVRRFVETSYPRLLANLAMVTGDREVAEDALQEALARAWARGERIASLEAWVGVVAMNVARSWFRRLGAERRARARMEALAVPAGTPAESDPELRRALAALPRRQREAVFARYYLDLGDAGAAAALGVSVGTVKKALHRARAMLAKEVQGEPVDR